ncbi:hypothetical protein MJO28_004613 [Puccinia striiformis f. sp. tritici]|uniref:Uncharacterized protein n=1 Tax=Puccinia striiformis f. sp. tritici TaxID=168172 RepID=A0ACC0ERL8_9BASI|nr:hypothetical protein MJO28_004613 [Puccinia striiformis f. sp. tritici]
MPPVENRVPRGVESYQVDAKTLTLRARFVEPLYGYRQATWAPCNRVFKAFLARFSLKQITMSHTSAPT